jgi:hypothetical protein
MSVKIRTGAAGSRFPLARSLMGLVAKPVLRIASIAAVCVGGVAGAAPEGIEGRWVSQKLTLDISRCSGGWCGVQVTDGACGRTVLRLDAGAPDGRSLEGRLQLAPESRPYWVRTFLREKDGDAPVISITGHTGDRLSPMRRTFDFSAVLARADAAACTPDSKVS